jgi:hypothetical protein
LDDYFDRQRREQMGTDQQRAKRKRNGLGNWKIVRYADDFVVMVSGQARHAEALREEVADVLAPMGLRLSPENTRLVHIDEGFDFLGFHIRRRRKRGTQKQCVYAHPVQEGRAGGQGLGAAEDTQVDPAFESGRADHQPEPDPAGLGNLLPTRRVLAGLPASRQSRLVADRRVDTREVEIKQL